MRVTDKTDAVSVQFVHMTVNKMRWNSCDKRMIPDCQGTDSGSNFPSTVAKTDTKSINSDISIK